MHIIIEDGAKVMKLNKAAQGIERPLETIFERVVKEGSAGAMTFHLNEILISLCFILQNRRCWTQAFLTSVRWVSVSHSGVVPQPRPL